MPLGVMIERVAWLLPVAFGDQGKKRAARVGAGTALSPSLPVGCRGPWLSGSLDALNARRSRWFATGCFWQQVRPLGRARRSWTESALRVSRDLTRPSARRGEHATMCWGCQLGLCQGWRSFRSTPAEIRTADSGSVADLSSTGGSAKLGCRPVARSIHTFSNQTGMLITRLKLERWRSSVEKITELVRV